jgi:hypothetical protein
VFVDVADAFHEAQAELAPSSEGGTGPTEESADGTTPETSEVIAPDTAEQPATSGEAEAEASEIQETPADDDPFKDIPDEELTQDQRDMKKRLLATFTKRRQADAEKAREAQEVAKNAEAALAEAQERLDAMAAEIAALRPQDPATATPEATFDPYAGFETVLKPEDVVTSEDFGKFVRQEAIALIRESNRDMLEFLGTQLQPVFDATQDQSLREATAHVDAFIKEHPIVETRMADVLDVMEKRAMTIDDAYRLVFADEVVEVERQAAFELGRTVGEKTAGEVLQRKQRISTPSGTPAPGVGTPSAPAKAYSVADALREAKADIGMK